MRSGRLVRSAQRGDETLYQQADGSISPALLWEQNSMGCSPRLRFDVDVPLRT